MDQTAMNPMIHRVGKHTAYIILDRAAKKLGFIRNNNALKANQTVPFPIRGGFGYAEVISGEYMELKKKNKFTLHFSEYSKMMGDPDSLERVIDHLKRKKEYLWEHTEMLWWKVQKAKDGQWIVKMQKDCGEEAAKMNYEPNACELTLDELYKVIANMEDMIKIGKEMMEKEEPDELPEEQEEDNIAEKAVTVMRDLKRKRTQEPAMNDEKPAKRTGRK